MQAVQREGESDGLQGLHGLTTPLEPFRRLAAASQATNRRIPYLACRALSSRRGFRFHYRAEHSHSLHLSLDCFSFQCKTKKPEQNFIFMI